MSLEKLKATKTEAAQFMVDEITTIIKTCGKRPPGSEGELKSVEYMASLVEDACGKENIKIEPFDLHPGAFMGWIYFTATFMIIGAILQFFIPIISVILIAIGFILMVGEFVLYKEVVDKLFPKKTSHNLIAIRKPKGETKRRIFFNGHPDAAPEWTLNYLGGGVLFIGHVAVAVGGGFFVLILCAIAAAKTGGGINPANALYKTNPSSVILILQYVSLIFYPAWIMLYWLWNDNNVVDGANDNLTGCLLAVSIVKGMHDLGIELENTEVGVLLTGSEEAGLRGAKAFVKQHPDTYHDVETIIISYDTIHEEKYTYVNTRDLNLTVPSDMYTSNLFKQACANVGTMCSYGTVPFGATDNAAFNKGGYKATGITSLNHNLQDYYHTRRDTYDNLDAECLANIFEASVELLRMYDEGVEVPRDKKLPK